MAQGALLSTAAASALLVSSVDPAVAISGGKESVGIFKPLDDGDLSGVHKHPFTAYAHFRATSILWAFLAHPSGAGVA